MKPLSEVKLKKKNLFKNFFLVTVLSTGISMLANALTKDAQTMIIIVPGTLCILFVAICYFNEFLGNSSYDIEVKSVLTVDDNQKVVPIRRFEFSEDISETVSSVLTENKAYEKIWKEAFTSGFGQGEKNKEFVKEFIEYQYINLISLKLNSYFSNIDKRVTEKISRAQIPDVLMKNRVIELISKPIEEREKFQKVSSDNNLAQGELYYVNGEDGVIYDRLELELPYKSKVYRKNDELVIENRAFIIKFKSKFLGFNTVLPRYFESYYMNRSMENTHNYLIDISMSIKMKSLFLLYVRDWRYIGWIDQIVEEFVEYFSIDDFVERIGFEEALTNHILFSNGLSNKNVYNRKIKDIKIEKIELGS